MRILAINTSNMTAQLALQVDDKKFFSELDASMKHSENLLPEIENLLLKANLKLSELEFLAVNVGPGSFTGLRISIATAKALLLTQKNLKAIKLNSFEILANNFFEKNQDEKISIILNALSGLYFTSEIDRQLNFNEPKMIEKQELNSLNNIVSDAEIENINYKSAKFTCENMLNVAVAKISNNDFCPENELVPLYIRPSQAEANLKKQ